MYKWYVFVAPFWSCGSDGANVIVSLAIAVVPPAAVFRSNERSSGRGCHAFSMFCLEFAFSFTQEFKKDDVPEASQRTFEDVKGCPEAKVRNRVYLKTDLMAKPAGLHRQRSLHGNAR